MSTVPEIENALNVAVRRAVRGRQSRRFWLRRRATPLAFALGLLLLGGAVAVATTGLLTVSHGRVGHDPYSIQSHTRADGSICLTIRFEGRLPASGCGSRPSTSRPLSPLVIARSPGQATLVYGLAAANVDLVQIVTPGGGTTSVTPHAEPSLPGRFFAVPVHIRERVEIVALAGSGHVLGRVGSLHRAQRSGNPARFAPAQRQSGEWMYKGRPISPDDAARKHLACLGGPVVTRCFDTARQMQAAAPTRPAP